MVCRGIYILEIHERDLSSTFNPKLRVPMSNNLQLKDTDLFITKVTLKSNTSSLIFPFFELGKFTKLFM